ncbi:MAG: fasciclin domain-containing protein [Cyanobacteria bacterium J06598_1]
MNKLTGLAAALMILPVAVACNTPTDDVATDPAIEEPVADTAPTESSTIVDVASANGSFDTLVAAVQAAGLGDTLSAEGPYTVFAPTDEAFAALPEGVLDKLLLPENQGVLTQILTYHVVGGEVPASAVETGTVPTVEGTDLDVVAEGGSVAINGVNVVATDVVAGNGIIHVIDGVLIPPTVDPAAL